MNSSELLDKWNRFNSEFPNEAKALKKTICEIYASRENLEEFTNKLEELKRELAPRAQETFGVDVRNKQAFTAWVSAMGFILLIKKERSTTGHHA